MYSCKSRSLSLPPSLFLTVKLYTYMYVGGKEPEVVNQAVPTSVLKDYNVGGCTLGDVISRLRTGLFTVVITVIHGLKVNV